MAVIDGVSYRSKDLEKVDLAWEKREVVHAFEDGWTIEWVLTPADLKLEGGILGHCAAQHAYWVHKKVEYLFSLRNLHGTSKATVHCKAAEWVGKEHPDDKKGPFQWEYPSRGAYGGTEGTKIDGILCGLSSTYYDHVGTDAAYYDQITFQGTQLCVISHTAYSEEYKQKVEEWLDSLARTPGNTQAKRGGYRYG